MADLLAQLLVLLALFSPAGEQGESSFGVGYADLTFEGEDEAATALNVDRAKRGGGNLIRQNLYWYRVAAEEPAEPADPDDPAYDFAAIDNTVREADAAELETFFTILGAPTWAEGPRRPSTKLYRAGTWRPQPGPARDFGAALARRYSGSHPDPERPGQTLPRVRFYEIWNEPNRSNYLAPQWQDGEHTGPQIYRRLLNGFYAGIKGAQPGARVITGGAAPYGSSGLTSTSDQQAGESTPLGFYRGLFCLRARLGLRRDDVCPSGEGRPHFDILGHHPINTRGGPRQSAARYDEITTADLDRLQRLLATARRYGTIADAERPRQLWATEIWWETDPPDSNRGVPAATQARWMADSLYQVWRQGGDAAVFLQVTDTPPDPDDRPFATYQTGIFGYRGVAKPAAEALAFPCVADERGDELILWAIPPIDGPLRFELREGDGSWKLAAMANGQAGAPKQVRVSGQRGVELGCSQGVRRSPSWRLRDS